MKDRVIRDPIYEYVKLPGELAPVVDSPQLQRLRRVVQTSLTSSVYPSATGSRFEHSLGAMHLSGMAFDAAWRNAEEEARSDLMARAQAAVPGIVESSHKGEGPTAACHRHLRVAVQCVALLHDVGHPPFSHILEDVFADEVESHLSRDRELLSEWSSLDGPFHERAGVLLSRDLVGLLPGPIGEIVRLIYEEHPDEGTWHGALHSIVAGEIDTDRLDYLVRDAQRAGTEFGAIDTSRLVDSLILVKTKDGDFRIVPGLRARSAFETLLIQRAQAYRWVIFHPRVLGMNLAMSRALESLLALSRSEDAALADYFDLTLPSLNYLSPVVEDLNRFIRPVVLDGLDPEKVREQLQASVDDSTIVEALKRALVICDLLEEAPHSSEISRLRTYAAAALFREKNFVVVWKTPEEFEEVARLTIDLGQGIAEILEAAYSRAAEAVPTSAAGRETERQALLDALQADPVAGFNRVIQLILSNREARRRFLSHLSTVRLEKELRNGYWDLVYSGFSAVRKGPEATVLWHGNQEIPLTTASPIVADLSKVNDKRPWITSFFFIPGKAISKWSAADAAAVREGLRRRFAKAFLSFLHQELPELLELDRSRHDDGHPS